MPARYDRLFDLLLVPLGTKINLKQDYDPSAARARQHRHFNRSYYEEVLVARVHPEIPSSVFQ